MATDFFVNSNKEVSKKMPPLLVYRCRGTLCYSPLAGTEKNSRHKDAAQTAFRSDPPMPVVLDTLERGVSQSQNHEDESGNGQVLMLDPFPRCSEHSVLGRIKGRVSERGLIREFLTAVPKC
jgi:hypothetical protein